jgi:hypothetical protein
MVVCAQNLFTCIIYYQTIYREPRTTVIMANLYSGLVAEAGVTIVRSSQADPHAHDLRRLPKLKQLLSTVDAGIGGRERARPPNRARNFRRTFARPIQQPGMSLTPARVCVSPDGTDDPPPMCRASNNLPGASRAPERISTPGQASPIFSCVLRASFVRRRKCL